MPPLPSLLEALVVEHGNKSLDDGEGGLYIDDSCHGVEDLHQKGSYGMLDLLTAGLKEERGTLLQDWWWKLLDRASCTKQNLYTYMAQHVHVHVCI